MVLKHLARIASLSGLAILTACTEPTVSETVQTPSTQSEIKVTFAQQHQDHAFAFLFGEWVGTATGRTAEGFYEVTQTERVGPMLDGDIIVVNGTGYSDDRTVAFEAFGIISKTPDGQGWQMRSYNDGREGTFPITLDGTSYAWTLPAGPDAKMEFQATVTGDSWVSTGTYHRDGSEPIETFRMTLTRQGPSGWPAAAAVSYK